MTLPAGYVGAHMTLGYVVTEHGAQGVTVDTSYEIATATTSANALYPGATRGRDANTIVVVTQAAPSSDAETGEIAQAIRRDPRAVLSSILESAQRDRAATAIAAQSAAEMGSMGTPGDMFAEIAGNAATARTAGWLDQLTADGALTLEQRQRLAAEDGATSLGRMLRRVELAGHNARQVLSDAIGQRGLDGARGLTNVIHKRIVEGWKLDPTGDGYPTGAATAEPPVSAVTSRWSARERRCAWPSSATPHLAPATPPRGPRPPASPSVATSRPPPTRRNGEDQPGAA